MNDSTQALAFFAGANSIFQGDVLLTAPNPEKNKDTIQAYVDVLLNKGNSNETH